jgi:hypothetical protein
MSDAPAPPAACLNCNEPFGAMRPRYCPACGQESSLKPPTMREFAQQFGGSYIAIEGALWRTLKLLLFKPGAITVEYLQGRRRRYVLPLRLYLTISVVVLLLMQALATVDIKLDDKSRTPETPKTFTIGIGFGETGLKDGVFFCNGLPAWVCTRVQRRLDIEPKAIMKEVAAYGERFLAHLGGAMFVLLPGFALWLRLVYRNRGLHYTEHLVFALHVHAFWFLMLGLIISKLAFVSDVAWLIVPIYTLLAMKRVYGGRWWPRLLRAGVVCMLYGITMVITLAGVALWALLF